MNKFISAIVLIIAGLLLTVAYTRGTYSEYRSINQEVSEYERTLDQADELADLQKTLTEKFNEIPMEQRDRIEKFLPRNIDTVRLTIEMNDIARKSGVEIDSFSFTQNKSNESSGGDAQVTPESGAPASFGEQNSAAALNSNRGERYSSVDMNFNVIGTYDNLRSFLNSLENNLRLTDVRSLTIQSNGEGQTTYGLVIRTYWLGT